jgi:hypothetical protein
LRDYQFTWHSPFVLCVCVLSPIPYVFFSFHSTPWVPITLTLSFFSTLLLLLLLRLLGFVSFRFYLSRRTWIYYRPWERNWERNFQLLVYDVNKGREIIMAVRRNTIIYLARRDFSALVLFPLSLSLSLLTSLVHVYNSILIGNPRGPSNTIENINIYYAGFNQLLESDVSKWTTPLFFDLWWSIRPSL